MGQLLSYSIGSGILLLAMYIIYKWVLANENQYRFNRIVLLSIYGISLVALPLISCLSGFLPQTSTDTSITHLQTGAAIIIPEQVDEPTFSPWRAILWVYLAGMVCIMLRTLLTIGKLCSIIRRGDRMKFDGCTLVLTDDKGISPFSWMHFVVMSREDYETSGEFIMAHERQHIRCKHWADLLIALIVIIVGWFNPATWLMREELKSVHEYEADKSVLNSGINAREYQMLLIKKAVGARFPSLANSLNHSKLKKRITMMNNQTTSGKRRMRVLALAPAIALAVLATEIPAVAQTLSATAATTLATDSDDKGTKKSLKVTTSTTVQNDNDTLTIYSTGRKAANVRMSNDSTFYYTVKVIGNTESDPLDINTTNIQSVTIDKQGETPVVNIVYVDKSSDDSKVFKIDGKVVDNVGNISPSDIESILVDKQGNVSIINIVRKK